METPVTPFSGQTLNTRLKKSVGEGGPDFLMGKAHVFVGKAGFAALDQGGEGDK